MNFCLLDVFFSEDNKFPLDVKVCRMCHKCSAQQFETFPFLYPVCDQEHVQMTKNGKTAYFSNETNVVLQDVGTF